jgi:uncharacterized membrane protein YfcA
MDETLAFLLPPGTGAAAALALVAISFVASALTGALGLGGGVLMLAAMAQLMPPAVLLPVHGLVQIGSNLGRATLMREHVVRPLVLPFAIGSLVGVAIGAPIAGALPRSALLIVLGAFLLWSAWSPKLRPARLPARWFFLPGALSSFCTMFVGATGFLVAAFLVPDPLTRREIVATQAALMTLQHALKVAAFAAMGFAPLPWLPLLAAMIAAGFAGTLAGRALLDRMPEHRFADAFKIMLAGMAIKLVFDGAASWPN